MKSSMLRRAYTGSVLAIGFLLMSMAHAQTFNVLHTFTGQSDGASPWAGLTLGRDGNLYGTTGQGGVTNSGTVYRLRRAGSGWILDVLYSFTDGSDGGFPGGRVSFGPDGALYGETSGGGVDYTCTPQSQTYGCGTVFKLSPPPTACKSASCPWTESVLHRFQGGVDGAYPSGDLTFDRQGNIYGTTIEGGSGGCTDFLHDLIGCGTVYELASSGGGAPLHVLYAFQGSGDNYADGVSPWSGVVFDGEGNLYGTTANGGLGGYNGYGVVYKLTPSSGAWSQVLLYSFTGGTDGGNPYGGLVFDSTGNLYGATFYGGSSGGGTAYELVGSNGGWSFSPLYSFSGNSGGPLATLTMDAAGNFYGTTSNDGAYGLGSVFKLSPSNGGWTYTSLHDFTGGSDGGYPTSNVILDASGNLYGTAHCGGNLSCSFGPGDGVVWEIAP